MFYYSLDYRSCHSNMKGEPSELDKKQAQQER